MRSAARPGRQAARTTPARARTGGSPTARADCPRRLAEASVRVRCLRRSIPERRGVGVFDQPAVEEPGDLVDSVGDRPPGSESHAVGELLEADAVVPWILVAAHEV